MKIAREDNDNLTIVERPLFVWIVGLIFVAGGLLLILFPGYTVEKMPLIISILSLLLGIACFLIAKKRELKIEKSAGIILLSNTSILKKEIRKFSISEIRGIRLGLEMETHIGKDANHGIEYFYWLEMLTETEVVELSSKTSRQHFGVQKVPEREIGQKIAVFLNIPFEDVRPPTIKEAIIDSLNA